MTHGSRVDFCNCHFFLTQKLIMKRTAFSHACNAFTAALIFSFYGQASAQLLYWDSNDVAAGFGSVTGIWGVSNFWNSNSGGGTGTFSIVTTSLNTVHFGTTSNYGNNAVAIDAGGVMANSIVYGSGQTTSISLGTAGSTLTLAGSMPTITVNNTRWHQVIVSPIGGSAGLTKDGAGTLVLRGANVYTGGTTVNAGTLSLGTLAAKSSGTHTFNVGTTLGLGFDGSLSRFTATDIQNAFTGNFTGNLSDISLDDSVNIAIDTTHGAQTFSANIGPSTRGLMKIANGSNLTLSGANQYSGRTVVGGGSALVVSSLGNIGDTSSNIGTNSTIDMLDSSRVDVTTTSSSDKNFNILGNTVIFAGDNATISHTGNISTATSGAKTLTLATNDTSLNNVKDFQGVISNGSGTIALTKSNAGSIYITGNNTYTGATSVAAGILIMGHANSLGGTAAGTTVTNGATLGIRNGITTSAEALTFTPGGSGTAMLRNMSGNNTWSGNITSNTGTASNLSRVASDANKLTINGTLSITGSVHQFVLQGDGAIDITGQITGAGSVTSATNGTGVRKLANDSNNYTGPTRINGGTLEFTSIANVGAASSLGAPANASDATIQLGSNSTSFPDATLRYVGTARAGHTSDRVINLATPNSSISVFTLQANGEGPWVLSSGVTAASGSKTLTLTGTSAAANSIGVIANGGSGTIAVTKSGPGRWILTGTNTYTGNTTVSQGTLIINGSTSESSAIIVNAGHLGGTGVINGSVTIGDGTGAADAIFSPGVGIGSISTGNLALSSDGSYAVELDGSAVASDASHVTGTVTLHSSSILVPSVAGTVVAGQKYFVVVNDGTDAITGTFSGFSQGSIVGSYGSVVLKISYVGDSVSDTTTGGNDIVLYAEALSVSPYNAWATAKSLTQSNNAKNLDPDYDGKNNLAEFALDGDPLSGSADGKLVGKIVTIEDQKMYTLTLPVRTGAIFTNNGGDQLSAPIDGVIYRVEGDEDLDTFASTIAEITGDDAAAIQAGLPALSSGWTYRTFRAPGNLSSTPKSFLRVQMTESP